jgi:hypothetical protein
MPTIRGEILAEHGDELRYAQRALLTHFRDAVNNATLTVDSDARSNALNVLYVDLPAIHDLDKHVLTLIQWTTEPQLWSLSSAAFWFASAAVGDKSSEDVTAALARFYQALSIPTYAEANQNPPTRHARFVWVDGEDELHLGGLADLAHHMELASLGGAPAVGDAYVADRGALVKVQRETRSVTDHENFFANVTLTVTLPDGGRVEHSWRSDLAV